MTRAKRRKNPEYREAESRTVAGRQLLIASSQHGYHYSIVRADIRAAILAIEREAAAATEPRPDPVLREQLAQAVERGDFDDVLRPALEQAFDEGRAIGQAGVALDVELLRRAVARVYPAWDDRAADSDRWTLTNGLADRIAAEYARLAGTASASETERGG